MAPSPIEPGSPTGPLPRVLHGTLSRDEAALLLAAHQQALRDGGAAALKDHRRSAVTRVTHHGQCLCIKEYKPLGWGDRLKDALRGSRAQRAWHGATRLAANGVSSPELVALLEHRGVHYLVAECVADGQPLNTFLAERFAGALPPDQLQGKRSLIRELARWLRSIHDLGIYHDDWSAKNLLVARRDGRWCFFLLDYESISLLRPLTLRRRVKNLGQLNDLTHGLTRSDRLRFLLAYAGHDPEFARGSFVAKVLGFTRRRIRHRERRLEDERA